MGDDLSVLFDDPEFRTTSFAGAASPENLFSILDTFEDTAFEELSIPFLSFVDDESVVFSSNELGKVGAKRRSLETDEEEEEEEDGEANLARKKLKFSGVAVAEASGVSSSGEQKVSHITVERNRRKQMNEHLGVLRSLMPCFYVKRGDQASIIGGVVDYIKELQQVLQSLEAKKQRKTYSEVLSPKPPASSPRSLPPLSPRVLPPLSPRPSPLSPRVGLPISPQTPQSGSPYKPTRNSNLQQPYPINDSSPSLETTSTLSQELSAAGAAANSRSAAAEVEVKFSGPHVLLSTVSAWNPGQIVKIISALEGHSLEILQVDINTVDDTMLNSFTIKIGIECELSAEELAQEIQQTFS